MAYISIIVDILDGDISTNTRSLTQAESVFFVVCFLPSLRREKTTPGPKSLEIGGPPKTKYNKNKKLTDSDSSSGRGYLILRSFSYANSRNVKSYCRKHMAQNFTRGHTTVIAPNCIVSIPYS